MDFRLLLSIIVLDLAMIALHTSQVSCQVSLTRDYDPDCIIEGTVVTLNCTVEDRNNGFGATIITGSQVIFDCSSINTATNNKLYLRHLHMQSAIASCGDLVSGQIVEVINGTYIAKISIITTIAMNGEYVECSELGIQDPQQIQLANIKASPDTTIFVQFPFDATFLIRYSNEDAQISNYSTNVIGENCGECTNLDEIASNITNQLSCTGWEPNGQVCNVTVTAAILSAATSVCGLRQLSTSRLVFLQDTAPTDIIVTVICSNNADNPDVQVEWEYTLPNADPSRLIPEVNGFLVIISNLNKNVSIEAFLNHSEARSYVFSSTSLQQAGLEGDVETIVTAVTEVGRFHNNLTFSLEGIITDIRSTLMIRQCIEVSINQQCNESADSFQALLQFADGACEESRLNKTTENYTLQCDYETCIPVGTDLICFSAVMFHNNGMEVARTGSQELILLQCNTSYISSVYNNGVTVTDSTTMGVVPQGTKVLHNTVLSFQCALLCKLIGTNTTRCVNGSFESLLNESSHCDCEQQTAVIAGASVGGLVAVIIIIIIIIICIVRIRDYLRAYFPKKQEAKDRKSDPVEHIDLHTFSDW